MDCNTQAAGVVLPDLAGKGKISVHLERLDLAPGAYSIDVGVFSNDWSTTYDYHHQAISLEIVGSGSGKGALLPPQHWTFSAMRETDLPNHPEMSLPSGHSAFCVVSR